MMRDIVVFEKDTRDGEKLGFRLAGMTLPTGSTPVAAVSGGIVTIICGTMVTRDKVVETAEWLAFGGVQPLDVPFVSPAEGL